MADFSDKNLALQMLAARDADGYPLTAFLRRSVGRYAILVTFAGILTILSVNPAARLLCVAGIGIFVGGVLRDFGWVRTVNRQWQFTKKAVDWGKVQKMADGELADD